MRQFSRKDDIHYGVRPYEDKTDRVSTVIKRARQYATSG